MRADFLRSLLKRLLNAFFPKRCPFCGSVIFPQEDCCAGCLPRLPRADRSKACYRCGKQRCTCGAVPLLTMTCSSFYYEELACFAVQRLKFGHRPGAALALGGFMAETVRETGTAWDIVVPIPMTIKKRRHRGYNQAELLCRVLSERLGIPTVSALCKIRETKAQHTLDAAARASNLSDAYMADAAIVQGKRVLLCDDVLTTGATLKEGAKALFQAGALEVGAVTLCSVERNRD